MPTKSELLEKKGRLANEARQIMDEAQRDGRESLRKEEEDKFHAIHADIESLTKTISMLNQQEDIERSLNDPGVRKSGPNMLDPDLSRGNSSLSRGLRDQEDAVRGWFLAGAKTHGPVPERHRQAAQRVGLDLNSSMLNFRLPRNPLTSTRSEAITRWESLHSEERANAGPQSTTSVGGYAIQDAAMREVEIALLAFGGVRRAGARSSARIPVGRCRFRRSTTRPTSAT
jgi:hypothetical protein